MPPENSIMRAARLGQKATLDDLSKILDVSKQRISQWETGESVPLERLQEWAENEALPLWVRFMASQMQVKAVQTELNSLASKIAAPLAG